jgi:sec-independent protein translocase protein TatA
MFKNLGSGEIIIILVVLLFVFGGNKLPEIARGLGQSGKELKKAKKEIENAMSDLKSDDTIKKVDSSSNGETLEGGDHRE